MASFARLTVGKMNRRTPSGPGSSIEPGMSTRPPSFSARAGLGGRGRVIVADGGGARSAVGRKRDPAGVRSAERAQAGRRQEIEITDRVAREHEGVEREPIVAMHLFDEGDVGLGFDSRHAVVIDVTSAVTA